MTAAQIEALLPAVEAGIRAEDDLTLAHKAAEFEAQSPTPVVLHLRAVVAAEQASRKGGEVR